MGKEECVKKSGGVKKMVEICYRGLWRGQNGGGRVAGTQWREESALGSVECTESVFINIGVLEE